MMNPFGIEHELLAWSAPAPLSAYHLNEDNLDIQLEVEPEVVFFKQIKALGIQGHPEWMRNDSEFVQYCLQLVEEKLK
jgi:glutamine amidotransferase PdxT